MRLRTFVYSRRVGKLRHKLWTIMDCKRGAHSSEVFKAVIKGKRRVLAFNVYLIITDLC